MRARLQQHAKFICMYIICVRANFYLYLFIYLIQIINYSEICMLAERKMKKRNYV